MKKGDQGISGQRCVRIESVDLNTYLFPSALDACRRWQPVPAGRGGARRPGGRGARGEGAPGRETRWNEVGCFCTPSQSF